MDPGEMISQRESMDLAWLGVLLAVAGNVGIAVGFVVQKAAHNSHTSSSQQSASSSAGDFPGQVGPDMPEPARSGGHVDFRNDVSPLTSSVSAGSNQTASDTTPHRTITERVKDEVYYVTSKRWWLGLALIFAGEILNAVAFGFASGSVVPPIGAVALAVIAVLSYFFLNERPSPLNWLGLALSGAGVILVGVFAPKGPGSESRLSAAETAMLTLNPRYYIFAFAILEVFAFLLVLLLVAPGIGSRHVIVFAALAGIAGMYKTRGTKSTLQMVFDMFGSERNAFRTVTLWLNVAQLVVATFVSLYFLNKGQGAFRQTLVIPVYFSIFSTLSVLSANLFYDEFSDPTFKIAPYVSGLVLLVLGVLLFSLPTSFSLSDVHARFSGKNSANIDASRPKV